ncbi:unnamed protein product, partial [Polarella glacialis]
VPPAAVRRAARLALLCAPTGDPRQHLCQPLPRRTAAAQRALLPWVFESRIHQRVHGRALQHAQPVCLSQFGDGLLHWRAAFEVSAIRIHLLRHLTLRFLDALCDGPRLPELPLF